MHYIDNFLNKITMYKTVLFGLVVLVVISVIFGFLGVIPFQGLDLILSLLLISTVCYVTNFVFSKIFKVATNSESWLITSLILFLILLPFSNGEELKMVALIAFIAMSSKYLLVIKKKHIFNPVAVAIFIAGLLGSALPLWWVGSSVLLIPTAIVGFLVLRKVQRFSLFFSFLFFALISTVSVGLYNNIPFLDIITFSFLSGPIIFFGAIMLTEPLTTPPKRNLQVVYGLIVGVFYGLQFHIGPVFSSPEMALLIGNIFSYIVSPRARLVLKLKKKEALAGNVDHFYWESEDKLNFKPGQYLEWTLGHKNPDMRGNRRYFTIASSPTEENIQLGVKFYDEPSSFKQALGEIPVGGSIIASQLSGEFTMPEDLSKKLVFIAGGIGVTPFRSMIKYMLDRKETRDVVFFFSNRTPKDIVYEDIWNNAEMVGVKTFHIVNDLSGEPENPKIRVGLLSKEIIQKEVSDYKDRIFYISGPRGMIVAFEKTLSELGVPKKQIKTDFFPGFA